MNDYSLNGLLDTVWSHLSRGVADRKHPARHPTLATIGPEGPEIRTLVLRGADRAGANLDLHTDAASPKYAQITADPRVALHVWVPKARLQIRMRGRAKMRQGDRDVFDRLPPEAQANYGGPAPGTPGNKPDGSQGDPARFALIRIHLAEIDALSLGDTHQRALFTATDRWGGAWIAP